MSCCSSEDKKPAAPFPEGTTASEAVKRTLAWMVGNAIKGVVVHPGGAIEFGGDPIPVTGYELDKDNPKLLRPLWPECDARMLGAQQTATKINLRVICQHKDAKHFGLLVQPKDCQGCPLRKQ